VGNDPRGVLFLYSLGCSSERETQSGEWSVLFSGGRLTGYDHRSLLLNRLAARQREIPRGEKGGV